MVSGVEVAECGVRISRSHLQERIVGLGRLVDLHVEAGAHDAAAVQRVEQRRLVDDAAARAVDEVGGGLHEGQLARADQVARVVLQRHVHGDEIGARQRGAEVGGRLAAHGLDLTRRVGRVDADAFEAERGQRLDEAAADAAEPDDQHGAAGHVLRVELHLAHVVALAHGAVELRQALGQGEHQGDGVLHHRGRVGEADGRHDHAALGRRRHVDVVDADAVAGDDLEVGRLLDHRRAGSWRGARRSPRRRAGSSPTWPGPASRAR